MVRIRLIQQGDGDRLWNLILAYLKETYAQGADFPPTLANATTFTLFAIEGAQVGDPCLVAEDGERLVGFCLARGIDFYGCETRYKTIRTHGTYVLPEYREKDVAQSLLLTAGHMAKLAGYDRFMGMTVGTDYEKHALGVGRRFPGMEQVGVVMIKDLRRKSKETSEGAKPNGADVVDAAKESDGVL